MSMQLSVFTRYAIRSLAANRTRTVVTAAGVALACALLTFVLVLVGSIRASLIASVEASEGAWQVSFSQIDEGQLARVEDELGDPLAVRRDLGAALMGDAEVPLLNVVTTLAGEKDLVVEPSLADGRWPEAPGEVAVPAYWAETWPVGSTVELSLGRRQWSSGGISAYDYSPSYELDEKGEAQLAEELVDVGEPRALTVVGIVDGDSDVAYVCPDEPGFGPEALTFAWAAPDLGVDELDQVTEGICEQGGYSSYHNALLEYLSLGNSRGFDMSVGFIGACASALACLVTVTLISGSFRVSVVERVRQFGLLSSAGASRRQLVRVVLAEAVLLCAVGVPVGLVLGFFALVHPLMGSNAPKQRKRMLPQKRYWLFYLLNLLMGGRRIVFSVFAVFLMVEQFGFSVRSVSLMFMFNYTVNWLFNPMVGKIINRLGERRLMTIEYISAFVIFMGYALTKSEYLIVLLYVFDSLTFNFSIAVRTFFQKIAFPEDAAPNMAIAQTINHIPAVTIPAVGGWMWTVWGYQSVFLFGAALTVMSLLLAQLVDREIRMKNTQHRKRG